MAGKHRFPNGTIQYTIKKAGLLDKPIYFTKPESQEAEGDAYAAQLEAMLAKGIVPGIVQERERENGDNRIMTIRALVREYERNAHPSEKDKGALTTVLSKKGDVFLESITSEWVDNWITEMKRADKLKPGTIRAKVGALARCTDWGIRKGYLKMPDHPLRTLPEGYASYTKTDVAFTGDKVEDVERDRRLEPGEYERILGVIDAGVLPRSQRPMKLEFTDALRCLFVLAVETAMRLREMYTLTLDQVNLKERTVFLEKTKNGDRRQVPLSSVAVAALQQYLKVREIPEGLPKEQLFPWWDGRSTKESLGKTTRELGKLFTNVRSSGIFKTAGCNDLHFHDLRHEATSRLYEKTSLSDLEISKITGHRELRMLARYANLRGSNLASKLW